MVVVGLHLRSRTSLLRRVVRAVGWYTDGFRCCFGCLEDAARMRFLGLGMRWDFLLLKEVRPPPSLALQRSSVRPRAVRAVSSAGW